MTTDGPSRQRFVANFLTVRSLMIFAAGFALALLLARTLPGAELFHPEGQVHRKDVVIIALNGTRLVTFRGFLTDKHDEFSSQWEEWDGELLKRALYLADQGNFRFALPARITYVVLPDGFLQAIRVEPVE
jgi:hypothetical protein